METPKYFAIRMGNMVIIRRTTKFITKVKSTLVKKGSDFDLVSYTYTGGKIVGALPYKDWQFRTRTLINNGGCLKTSREVVRGLKPFLTLGE